MISSDEALEGLIGALRFFRQSIMHLIHTVRRGLMEEYLLVIVLGAYLYSKYYKCGDKRKSGYFIIADKIRNLYLEYDEGIANVAFKLIDARNLAVHVPWAEDTNEDVRAVLSDKNFIRLLRCEGIVDKDGNFVEPVGGKYVPVSDREEALANIKAMVDKVNAEDDEKAKHEVPYDPASLAAAVAKMQGE